MNVSLYLAKYVYVIYKDIYIYIYIYIHAITSCDSNFEVRTVDIKIDLYFM